MASHEQEEAPVGSSDDERSYQDIDQAIPPVMDEDCRLFVAKYDYSRRISPNQRAEQEELSFRKHQLIKVFGDMDQDGFFHGQIANRVGLVPSNFVIEIAKGELMLAREQITGGAIIDQARPPRVDEDCRLFVALYDYFHHMSHNQNAEQEELFFRKHQLIKVFGDVDSDGFFHGQIANRVGFVPSNMVIEIARGELEPTGQQTRGGSIIGPTENPSLPRVTWGGVELRRYDHSGDRRHYHRGRDMEYTSRDCRDVRGEGRDHRDRVTDNEERREEGTGDLYARVSNYRSGERERGAYTRNPEYPDEEFQREARPEYITVHRRERERSQNHEYRGAGYDRRYDIDQERERGRDYHDRRYDTVVPSSLQAPPIGEGTNPMIPRSNIASANLIPAGGTGQPGSIEITPQQPNMLTQAHPTQQQQQPPHKSNVNTEQSLAENTRENRVQYIKYVNHLKEDGDGKTRVQTLSSVFMHIDLLLALYTMYTGSSSVLVQIFLLLFTFMPMLIALVDGTTIALLYAVAVCVNITWILQRNGSWSIYLWLFYGNDVPDEYTYALLAIKIVIVAIVSWAHNVEAVARISKQRDLAEEAADYRSIVLPATTASDEGDDEAATSAPAGDAPAAAAEPAFFVKFIMSCRADAGLELHQWDHEESNPVFVSAVIPRGAAERSGKMNAGCEIISINGVRLEGASALDLAETLMGNIKGDVKLECRYNPSLLSELY